MAGFSQERLDRDRAGHPLSKRCRCRRQPAAALGKRSRRTQPDVEPGRGQDHPARSRPSGCSRRRVLSRCRGGGRPGNQPRRGTDPGLRRARGADQHRPAAATWMRTWSATRWTRCRWRSGAQWSSSRMWATWYAPPPSISARPPKWSFFRSAEGDDKPLKYPDMFAGGGPHGAQQNGPAAVRGLRFRSGRSSTPGGSIPDIVEMRLSARSGEGTEAWLDWVRERVRIGQRLPRRSIRAPDRTAHRGPRPCMSSPSREASSKWSTSTRMRTARGGLARVQVRLGVQSALTRALHVSFRAASRGTRCEGAILGIEEVPLTVYCRYCDDVKAPSGPYNFRCPVCGHATPKVVTGREMQLVSIVLGDDARAGIRRAESALPPRNVHRASPRRGPILEPPRQSMVLRASPAPGPPTASPNPTPTPGRPPVTTLRSSPPES